MMVFRAEFLKNNIYEFDEIFFKLRKLKKNMELTYKSISEKEMAKGKKNIIELNKEYSKIFEDILKICQRMI